MSHGKNRKTKEKTQKRSTQTRKKIFNRINQAIYDETTNPQYEATFEEFLKEVFSSDMLWD